MSNRNLWISNNWPLVGRPKAKLYEEKIHIPKAIDPFNIIIRPEGSQVDLNIHPQEAGTYKIIYHGALLGEIFMGSDGENWEAVTADELEPGGFPVYAYDETSGHQDLLLDQNVIDQIGREIALTQN